MPDLRDEFEALMPEPAILRTLHADRLPEAPYLVRGYTADQLRAAMQAVAERAAKKEREECAKPKTPLSGRWHHGEGVLVSGSIRIARWDCDTNPPDSFREELLDWMCKVLNAAQAPQPLASAALIEELCARIKAADDEAMEGDYMLDSNDCIAVLRGTWPTSAAAIRAREGKGGAG